MTAAPVRKQLAEEFSRVNLTPDQFSAFYTTFIGLRFPLDVSEVLDLRSLINHAVDEFSEPPLTPDYRQFRESLEKALDSFAVESPHHRERLLKALALLRELHVAHSLVSRNAEESMRIAIEDNRLARRHATQRGLLYVIATALSIVGWFTLPTVEWMLQLLSVLCAAESWRNFHRLPKLDQRAQELRQQLNDLLRQRVNTIDWKTLIYKLALVLGVKNVEGIEVFRLLTDTQEIRNITGSVH
jgi:hypothetical protein